MARSQQFNEGKVKAVKGYFGKITFVFVLTGHGSILGNFIIIRILYSIRGDTVGVVGISVNLLVPVRIVRRHDFGDITEVHGAYQLWVVHGQEDLDSTRSFGQ